MLQRFDQDGLELFIDIGSGECFASVRGLARMCGVSASTISRWVTVAQIEIKSAEIPTTTGIKTVALLLDENSI